MAKIGTLLIVILAIIVLSSIITGVVVFVQDEMGLATGVGRVAVIKLDGEIMSEGGPSLFSSSVPLTPDRVKGDIDRANSLGVDAILFEVNSPGGTVLATKEIGEEIEKINITKIALVKEMAASGGYWITTNTDYIIADDMSIVGSIGVIGSYLEFSGLMDKYGVGYEQLTAGKYKDAGTPYRNMTTEEKQLFQERLDIIHNEFKKEVAENRHMTQQEVDAVSEGLFYMGSQSVENKLIDQTGNRDTAEQKLKEMLNATEIKFIDIEEPPTLLESLAKAMSSSFFYMGKGIGTALTEVKAPVSNVEVYT